MSAIEKIAVYDPRIVQDAPAYAVQKGALAVTVSPFQAVSATTSQHTYQVLVPSLNVFVDRKVMWQSTVYVQMDAYWSGDCTTSLGQVPLYKPNTFGQSYVEIRPGEDFVLPMFPLQSLCTNMTASINDCVVTTNGDTLREQILLTETQSNQQQRTTPSKFDKYAWSIDDVNSLNGCFGAYQQSQKGAIPNGAWPITFVAPDGTDITSATSPAGMEVNLQYLSGTPGVQYQTAGTCFMNGIPCWKPSMDVTKAMRICFRFTVTEPLVMSPFIWNDAHEFSEVGLYGCTNMAFTMNLQSTPSNNSVVQVTDSVVLAAGGAQWYDNITSQYNPIGNLVRASGIDSLFANVTLGRPTGNSTNTSNNAFSNPQLLVSFLTPGVDVDLPLCSSVPYHEFPRYYTNQASLDTSGIVQTQTITLSSIPDMIMVWVKPTIRGQTQNETYVPISRVGVTFDNFSNLCSNFSQQNLYNSSVAAGLDMDYLQWSGSATADNQGSGLIPYANAAAAPQGVNGGTYFPTPQSIAGQPPFKYQFGTAGATRVQLTGGPLLLRMGTDVSLSPGLAPGCLGNYSIQLALTLDLSSGYFKTIANSASGAGVTITLMAITSGFFETVRGQSAVRKTILNNVDVEQARASSGTTHSQLSRFVGGSKHKMSSSSFLNFAAKHHKGKGGDSMGGSSMGGSSMGGSMGGARASGLSMSRKRPSY